jgi:hypothetical protein
MPPIDRHCPLKIQRKYSGEDVPSNRDKVAIHWVARKVRAIGPLFAEAMLDQDGELIVRNIIDLAVKGDPVAMRLCFERLVPKRERPVQFNLPDVDTIDGAKSGSKNVVEACARGDLSPREANRVMSVVSSHINNLANRDVDERIRGVERKAKDL